MAVKIPRLRSLRTDSEIDLLNRILRDLGNAVNADSDSVSAGPHTIISATHTDTIGVPALNDVLTWNGSAWTPMAPSGGGVTDHGLLTGLGDDDHLQYLLLAGRSGGQIAKGGTASGEDLTLVSTAHATKGSIILGQAAASEYLETTDRLGIKKIGPLASLHVIGEPGANSVVLPSSIKTAGSWTNAAAGAPAVSDINSAPGTTDASYVVSGGADNFEVNLTAIGTPGIGSTVVVKFRAQSVGADTGLNAFLVEGPSTVRATISTSSSAVTGSFTTFPVTLTPAQFASITNWSNLYLRFSRFAGINVRISEAWMEVLASPGKTALFQAVSAQVETLTEWRDSASAFLGMIDVAGRLSLGQINAIDSASSTRGRAYIKQVATTLEHAVLIEKNSTSTVSPFAMYGAQTAPAVLGNLICEIDTIGQYRIQNLAIFGAHNFGPAIKDDVTEDQLIIAARSAGDWSDVIQSAYVGLGWGSTRGAIIGGGEYSTASDYLLRRLGISVSEGVKIAQLLRDAITPPSALLHVKVEDAAKIVSIIQGFTGQTANLTEWRNQAGTVLSAIDKDGKFTGTISDRTRRLQIPLNSFTQSNGPAATFGFAGTYPNRYKRWVFPSAPASVVAIYAEIVIPPEYVSGGTLYLLYTSQDLVPDDNSFVMRARYACLNIAAEDDIANQVGLVTAATNISKTSTGVGLNTSPTPRALAVGGALGTLALGPLTGLTAGDFLRLHIERLHTDAADTYADAIDLVGVYIEWTLSG